MTSDLLARQGIACPTINPSQQPNLGTPGAANHRPWLSSSYLDFGVEVDHAVRRQNKSGRELLALHQVAAPEPEPL
jgi:hypothetical protein